MSNSRLAAAGLTVALSACGSLIEPPPDPLPGTPLKLLACNPITGSLSYLGSALEHGMDLAADEINRAGGISGRPLQLIKVDSHSDEQSAIREAAFFYGRDREIVGIAGAAADSVSKRLLLDLARNGFDYGQRIPMISPASTSAEFTGLLDAQYNLFFRTVCSSRPQGGILAQKAVDLELHSGAALVYRDINHKEILQAFQDKFLRLGADWSLAVEQYEDVSITGISQALTTVVERVRAKSGRPPEFLLLLSYGDDGKIALREWARSYASTPLLLSSALMSDYFLSSLDPNTLAAFQGAIVNGVVPTTGSGSVGAKAFAPLFCGKYPESCTCEPSASCNSPATREPQIFAANAYDAVLTFGLALQTLQQRDPALLDRASGWNLGAMKDALLAVVNQQQPGELLVYPGQWHQAATALTSGDSINYEGAGSSSLEFDLNGDPVNCDYAFWTVVAGKVVLTNSAGDRELVNVRL